MNVSAPTSTPEMGSTPDLCVSYEKTRAATESALLATSVTSVESARSAFSTELFLMRRLAVGHSIDPFDLDVNARLALKKDCLDHADQRLGVLRRGHPIVGAGVRGVVDFVYESTVERVVKRSERGGFCRGLVGNGGFMAWAMIIARRTVIPGNLGMPANCFAAEPRSALIRIDALHNQEFRNACSRDIASFASVRAT